MKLNTTDFLRKSQFPLMILLGMFPIPMLVMLYNAPEVIGALAFLLPVCLLLSWLCMLLPGKVRVASALLGCGMMLALGFHYLPIHHTISAGNGTLSVSPNVFTVLIPILMCLFLLYSLRFAAWPHDQEIAFNWYAAGVFAHLIMQLLTRAARLQGVAAWEQAAPILTAAFIGFMLLALLSMNRATMTGAALGRQKVPVSMRRRNAVFTVCLLGLALAVAAFPAIARALSLLWSSVIHTVGAVVAFIARLLEQNNTASGGGAPGEAMFLLGGETAEPSLFAKLLEWIATAISVAAVILFVLLGVRFLIRRFIRLLRLLRERLTQYMTAASQDYVDEITDTREENGEASSTLLNRLRRSLLFVNERRLSPAERIRYRYRLLLRRHPDWARSATARENLPPDAASLYEQARYSGQEMTGEQAEQFTADVRSK